MEYSEAHLPLLRALECVKQFLHAPNPILKSLRVGSAIIDGWVMALEPLNISELSSSTLFSGTSISLCSCSFWSRNYSLCFCSIFNNNKLVSSAPVSELVLSTSLRGPFLFRGRRASSYSLKVDMKISGFAGTLITGWDLV